MPLPQAPVDPPRDPARQEDLMDLDQEEPPQAGPWQSYGLNYRPHWWHYWEERQNPNPPPPAPRELNADVEQQAAQRAAQEFLGDIDPAVEPAPEAPQADLLGEIPPAVERQASDDMPPESDDSNAWRQWHSRRQSIAAHIAAQLAEQSPSFPPADFDWSAGLEDEDDIFDPNIFHQENFHAPPLTDGPWNKSTHVSKLIAKGFDIQVDVTKRGKMPRMLALNTPQEKAYIKQLLDDGILEQGDIIQHNPHFFIYKPGKIRLIFDGRNLNKGTKTPPRFNMKSHHTIERLSTKYAWHAADDLSNMFFSIKLGQKTRPYFGIRTSLGSFRYTSLPFGFSWAPFISHIAVDEICKRALEAGHAVTHYADDFHYFGHTKQQCATAVAFVRDLFKQSNWQVNTRKHQPPARQFTALGIEYNLFTKTKRIPPKSLQTIMDEHSRLLKADSAVTRKKLASLLGSAVFWNYAYDGILSLLGPTIAFIRAGGKQWNKHYHYRDFAPFFEKFLRRAMQLTWTPFQVHADKPVDIFTDATNTQLGIITPAYTAAAIIPFTQIYRAEALAVKWLLEQRLPKSFRLRIDNLALVHAIKKGRSNIPEANYVCHQLLQLRQRGHTITASHIRTENNPADVPSRIHLGPLRFFVSPSLPQD